MCIRDRWNSKQDIAEKVGGLREGGYIGEIPVRDHRKTEHDCFWKESSDVRLKSNIKDLNHTLEQICQIPTKSFEMLGKEVLFLF